jgi:hypothetical protein
LFGGDVGDRRISFLLLFRGKGRKKILNKKRKESHSENKNNNSKKGKKLSAHFFPIVFVLQSSAERNTL